MAIILKMEDAKAGASSRLDSGISTESSDYYRSFLTRLPCLLTIVIPKPCQKLLTSTVSFFGFRICKDFHMLGWANFPDEASEKAVSFCDKTKLGGWAQVLSETKAISWP